MEIPILNIQKLCSARNEVAAIVNIKKELKKNIRNIFDRCQERMQEMADELRESRYAILQHAAKKCEGNQHYLFPKIIVEEENQSFESNSFETIVFEDENGIDFALPLNFVQEETSIHDRSTKRSSSLSNMSNYTFKREDNNQQETPLSFLEDLDGCELEERNIYIEDNQEGIIPSKDCSIIQTFLFENNDSFLQQAIENEENLSNDSVCEAEETFYFEKDDSES